MYSQASRAIIGLAPMAAKSDRIGNIGKDIRVLPSEGKEAPRSNRSMSSENQPATFNWLDLQEVSQSCPAETLFLATTVVRLNHLKNVHAWEFHRASVSLPV
jgi:hypothetical protein